MAFAQKKRLLAPAIWLITVTVLGDGRNGSLRKLVMQKPSKKQAEASTYTGLPIPRPGTVTFAAWAIEWLAQKDALCKAGKKPRPSTLHSWQSDLKSLLAYFGD